MSKVRKNGMLLRATICYWLLAWLLTGCDKTEAPAPYTAYAGGRVSLRLAAVNDSLEISVLNDTGLIIAVDRLLPISGSNHEVSLRIDGETPSSASTESRGDPDIVDPATLGMKIRPDTFDGTRYSWPDVARFFDFAREGVTTFKLFTRINRDGQTCSANVLLQTAFACVSSD